MAIGRIVGSWGIRGHVKVVPLTDFPERFLPDRDVYLDGRPTRVMDRKERRAQVILKLLGIDTPEAASRLRGQLLTIPEDQLEPLEEDRFYRFQLMDSRVVDHDGGELGAVADILDTGETQVLVVRGDDRETLIPLVEGFVTSVDVEAKTVQVDSRALAGGNG